MAGDWIKMRTNLWDDPRVSRLCDLTGAIEATIVGGLYWLWSMADDHTEDGVLPGMTTRSIDRKTGVNGLGDALVAIGWITDHPDGLMIVGFEEHNGTSAKRRCMEAQRKATVRTSSATCPDDVRNVSASHADKTQTESGHHAELEKRREEINTSSLRSDVKKPRASRKAEPSGSLSVDDLVAEGVSERHAIDWMRVRKDKGAKSLTQTAWLLVKTEAAKAGLSPAQAVEMSAANSWQGFKAEWVKPQSTTGPGRHLERPLTPSERAAYASTPSICSERVRRLMEQEQKNGQQNVIEMEVGHVAAISMG